ncbi:DNA damage-induced cell division inhibitor SosA [Staphylococcus haemolyticus]|uniref:DNA damage-induced cell division inhibitor SosA n=2 Tax=Staphylococcus haemolyticus TaxID=1283 RepID=UPI0021B6D1E9|nr:DNA damage-induced cell division inhibitor SosA [Staphylococcus haemolyticus]
MTKNRCSVKVFIQTNVLEVKVMFNKYKNKSLTNIAVVSISCVVFIVFFMNLYHNAQMEQTYEITDHTISKKAIIKDDNKNVNTTNGEQNNYKVFAFVR